MKTLAKIRTLALLIGIAVFSASFVTFDGCDPSSLLKKKHTRAAGIHFCKIISC